MPAKPVPQVAATENTTAQFAYDCVIRRRSIDIAAENHSTARMTSPCSHAFDSPPVSTNCQIVTTASPVATMTRMPGHQAQKPAKKPQNGPSAFCVQT